MLPVERVSPDQAGSRSMFAGPARSIVAAHRSWRISPVACSLGLPWRRTDAVIQAAGTRTTWAGRRASKRLAPTGAGLLRL